MRNVRSIRSLLLALAMLSVSAVSSAQVLLSVNFGPPALPVYEQPVIPSEGFIWVPGYWAWSPVGYYWVPGTWALAPEPGLLWTPGYWAYDSELYYWHPGYWGPVVGYYGGIPYGFGYPGTGYYGGYWRGRQYYYNQTVNKVSTTNIRNVYSTPVVKNTTIVNRASHNGGPRRTTLLGLKPSRVALQHHVPRCLVHRVRLRGRMRHALRIAQLHNDPAPLLHAPRTNRRTTLLGLKPSRVALQHRVPKCLVHRVRLRGRMRHALRMPLTRKNRLARKTHPIPRMLLPRTDRLARKLHPVRGKNLPRQSRLIPTKRIPLTNSLLHPVPRRNVPISNCAAKQSREAAASKNGGWQPLTDKVLD